MTHRTTTATTCDICGKMEVTSTAEMDCYDPLRWGEMRWWEPPEEGEKHRRYKSMDLCPDHLNSFLKWVQVEQEKHVRP